MVIDATSKKADLRTCRIKKEKQLPPPSTKIVIRKLPPTFTEEEFKNAVSPLPEHNYFSFVPGDAKLGQHAYSRAYINFIDTDDIFTFTDKFDGYVFVDQKGNEYHALVEYAPFQKLPKVSSHHKKDLRCGTINEDPDYLQFLNSLENPESVPLLTIESLLEEIETIEKETQANNGLVKIKTPLLEYLEHRSSERLRPGDRKRRKELERKQAREEAKRKKKEFIRDWRYQKREEKREERKKRDEERQMWKERREKEGKERTTRALKEKENRVRKEKTTREKSEEKLKLKDSREEDVKTVSASGAAEIDLVSVSSPKDSTKVDKISVSEKDKSKEINDEVQMNTVERSEADGKVSSEGDSKQEKSKDAEDKEHQEKTSSDHCTVEESDCRVTVAVNEITHEQETEETLQLDNKMEEAEDVERKEDTATTSDSQKEEKNTKDPRTERRIRNKDRPAMQLYRPGQSRLKSNTKAFEDCGDEKGKSESSSTSSSPVMAFNEDKKKETRDDAKEEVKEKPAAKPKDGYRGHHYEKKTRYRDSRGGYYYWEDEKESYGGKYKENYGKYKEDCGDYEGRSSKIGGRRGYSYHHERENKGKVSSSSKSKDHESFGQSYKSLTFRRSTSQE